MSSTALFIKHKTLLGKRSQVQSIWLKHMAPAIQENQGHMAYFYCQDNADPESICAFQQYTSPEEAQAFLSTQSYLSYLREVESLLEGPPQVVQLTPVWVKKP
ncbi:putative quinol monooxygenase [Aquabacterium sp. OR-4]|uniref:putative quinol monooxygenase n=1 Tax=Aquabacterium sp. OR-4 TaxID=2978127 RepID=UPI0021B18D4D|nr:antibiotic biosynthesis monooxygenase [Aquabacterium sp. OR-4]MDT7838429.1 antibiotic biosynthesis monooxygenase [Aquabacterium sp. OR-4]